MLQKMTARSRAVSLGTCARTPLGLAGEEVGSGVSMSTGAAFGAGVLKHPSPRTPSGLLEALPGVVSSAGGLIGLCGPSPRKARDRCARAERRWSVLVAIVAEGDGARTAARQGDAGLRRSGAACTPSCFCSGASTLEMITWSLRPKSCSTRARSNSCFNTGPVDTYIYMCV